MENNVTISACMMVKDEEKHLERCLSSISSLVDEIILVDTGSTDNTLKIAEKFGCKIYNHPWTNDFSFHRNQSIGYATSKWMLVIDADEECVINDVVAFKKWLGELPSNKVSAMVHLFDMRKGVVAMSFNTARLFKKGHVRYENIVHNQPIITKGKEGAFCDLITLKHYGYDLTDEEQKQKEKRTLTLLNERVSKNKNDYEAWFYLTQVHATMGRSKESVKCGEFYLKNKEKNKTFCNSIYFVTFQEYMKLKDLVSAKRWLDEAMKTLPYDLDICVCEVEYGIVSNTFFLIQDGARRYMSVYKKVMEKPEVRGNGFGFCYTPQALAYVVYQLAFAQLNDSFSLLNTLSKVLPQTPKDFMNGMLKEVKKKLNDFGINSKVELQNEKGELIQEINVDLDNIKKQSIQKMFK